MRDIRGTFIAKMSAHLSEYQNSDGQKMSLPSRKVDFNYMQFLS